MVVRPFIMMDKKDNFHWNCISDSEFETLIKANDFGIGAGK